MCRWLLPVAILPLPLLLFLLLLLLPPMILLSSVPSTLHLLRVMSITVLVGVLEEVRLRRCIRSFARVLCGPDRRGIITLRLVEAAGAGVSSNLCLGRRAPVWGFPGVDCRRRPLQLAGGLDGVLHQTLSGGRHTANQILTCFLGGHTLPAGRLAGVRPRLGGLSSCELGRLSVEAGELAGGRLLDGHPQLAAAGRERSILVLRQRFSIEILRKHGSRLCSPRARSARPRGHADQIAARIPTRPA